MKQFITFLLFILTINLYGQDKYQLATNLGGSVLLCEDYKIKDSEVFTLKLSENSAYTIVIKGDDKITFTYNGTTFSNETKKLEIVTTEATEIKIWATGKGKVILIVSYLGKIK